MTVLRMGLLNKRADMSTSDFQDYWKNVHSRLARTIPGLVQYQQNHVTDSVQRGIAHKRGPDAVDGISQLWFKSLDEMRSNMTGSLGQALIDDENRFIGHLRIVTAETTEVIPPPTSGKAIKRMSFLRRRSDVTPERFAYEWKAVHGPLVKTMPGVLGYRQNLIVDREAPKGKVVGYDGLPIDGIVELWFESSATLDAAFSSPAGVKTMEHAKVFIDEITTFLVEPHVVL